MVGLDKVAYLHIEWPDPSMAWKINFQIAKSEVRNPEFQIQSSDIWFFIFSYC